jgi:hypothetical protein
MLRRAAGVTILAASLTVTARARAEVPEAEKLFQDAKQLVEGGHYAEACPKLERSQALDPAVGTQFNLADCYEHVGRTATAHAIFLDVARIARAAGKFEREKSAKERAAALAPKLGRLRVGTTTTPPGLEIRVDDRAIEKASWGKPEPVDAGTHQVRAAAPGFGSWEGTVSTKDGALAEIVVPALVDKRPKQVTIVTQPPSTQRTIALVLGGVGIVGLGVGAVAGGLSLSHRSKAESACAKDVYQFRCPTEDGASEWNAATTTGNISTIGFIAGGVAIAGATVLWFTAPRPRTRVGLSPRGLVVDGSF